MADSIVFALIAAAVAIFVIFELIAMSRIRALGLKLEPEKIELETVKEETSREECPHFLGYLASHPKNQPVPDGCFGCKRAAECINSSSTRILSRKSVGAAEVEQR